MCEVPGVFFGVLCVPFFNKIPTGLFAVTLLLTWKWHHDKQCSMSLYLCSYLHNDVSVEIWPIVILDSLTCHFQYIKKIEVAVVYRVIFPIVTVGVCLLHLWTLYLQDKVTLGGTLTCYRHLSDLPCPLPYISCLLFLVSHNASFCQRSTI